ncbi:MAG: ABC transporter ATP-binding protein [Actinomycetota bacterium]|nr:ABC transporter ATP-binding protein [Actinomycetota bacterium]
MADPLLSVRDLSVSFPTDDGLVEAVRDVSFDIAPGEVLSVVGESGSGKSVSALAVMRLHPKRTRISGEILYDGRNLLSLSDREMRRIRGGQIAMIFQDPMTALNPVFTVGDQIVETLRVHQNLAKSAAYKRAAELLDLVGVPEPGRRVHQYPHEFSGGMRQRAMIAIAIANDPKILIADEPTTALDVTIQAQVMEVLADVQKETGAAILLITHDLGLVAGTADRVQVMYGGRIFERGTTDDIFYKSANPYTRALLASIPRLDAEVDRLDPIPGAPPSVMNRPRGCSFRPRCDHAVPLCRQQEPDLLPVSNGVTESRCHLASELPAIQPVVAGESA